MSRNRRSRHRESRRAFLRTLPAAVAAGVYVPRGAGAQTAPAPAVASHPEITTATLKCAENLAGLTFTEAEQQLMLGLVKDNRGFYDALREVRVPAETEPVFGFRPPVPAPSGGAAVRAVPKTATPSGAATPRVEVRENLDTLAFQPVTVLAEAVRSRQVTSTALTRMYLDRLKTHGQRLQAVVTLTEEVALAQAASADREIAAGRYRGALHGMPWGVKDLFATRRIRTTWGAKPYEHQVLETDATTVARLRDAGAVLVAKLVSGELAHGNLWFGGRTANPWDPARSPGGSSAGPGAATAGGLVAFSIGTSTGASVVQPAAFCGAVGLQPTYGRVSRYGVMTLAWTLDRVGPICRSVEDCMLVLSAIAGPDGRDATVADLPMPWDARAPLGKLRIGYAARTFEEAPAGGRAAERWPARRAVLQSALDVFRGFGSAEPIELPNFPITALFTVVLAEGGASFDELVRSGAVSELSGKGPSDRASSLRASRFIPAVEYIRAQRVRTLLIQQLNAIFQKVDVIVCPPDLSIVRMTSLSGHPCITLKAGFVEGMPEGFLVIGPLYGEGIMARVALAYEQATEWKDRHPAMS